MKVANFRWHRNLLAWLYLLIASLFYLLNGETIHENETLLFVLNTIFIGILPLGVAVMAGYSYLHNKSISILSMSCGMLVFGIGSILTAMIRRTPNSGNAAVTTYNLCVFYSAICHFAAVVKAVRRKRYNAAIMRVLPLLLYTFTVLYIIAVYIAAQFSLLPAFIDQNGGTGLRSVILWLSVTCFIISFLELRNQFLHQERVYLYWYAHSLMMTAVGLIIVFLSAGVGTMASWIGRAAHYLGAIFALYAMIGVSREARQSGRSLAHVMEDFFIDEGSGYKNLATESNSAMFITDSSFNIRFVNASALSMLGRSKNELMYTSFLGLFSNEYAGKIRQDFEDHVSTGASYGSKTLRLTFMNRYGYLCSAEMVAAYHTTYAGGVCTFILQDISERERAYKEIEQKNAALRTINQIFEIAIYGAGALGFASQCLEIILNATKSSCGLLCALGDDGMLKVMAAKHNKSAGCGFGAGTPIPFPAGTCTFLDFCNDIVDLQEPGMMQPQVSCEANNGKGIGHAPGLSYLGVPLVKNSKVVCLLALRNDERVFQPEDRILLEELIPAVYEMLQKEQAKEALRVSSSLVRAILDGTHDPVFLKDVNGRFQMGNNALSEVLGMPLEAILGQADYEIYDKEKAINIMEHDQQVLATGKVQTFEEEVPTTEGVRTYLSNKTPWIDEQGVTRGIIGIAQDITERKKMELALKKQSIDLEVKNKLVTDFFINISHEFKTPLSVIVLITDMLENEAMRQTDVHEGILRYLGILRVNAFRLRRLVSNLLDITKLDGGFMQPRWEDVNVVRMLQNLVESTAFFAKKKELSLIFQSSMDELNLSTDSLMLERIVLNLLSNAIKHTKKGGTISVVLLMQADMLNIFVKDNGEGIPQDMQAIIFDRFRQVNTSLTRSSEGCGIGLSITKSLVELLGGTIAFESTLGLGSIFSVLLPITHNEACVKQEQDGTELSNRIQLELSDISFD